MSLFPPQLVIIHCILPYDMLLMRFMIHLHDGPPHNQPPLCHEPINSEPCILTFYRTPPPPLEICTGYHYDDTHLTNHPKSHLVSCHVYDPKTIHHVKSQHMTNQSRVLLVGDSSSHPIDPSLRPHYSSSHVVASFQ